MLQILLAVAMRGPMGRIDGVQSLPDLKDRSEPPLPILEPVPTFSVGPKPQTQQTQVLSTPVSSRVGTANGRVGTANGRRPVSSKKNLPSLGVWRAHFADKDLPKELQIGDRWWISSEIQRTVHGKKLPRCKPIQRELLQSKLPTDQPRQDTWSLACAFEGCFRDPYCLPWY